MTEENYSIEMENRVVRQLSKIAYFFKPQKLVLNDEQYCHVIDKDTGNVSTREGECKIVLDYDEAIVGNIEDKVVVKENWFAVIKNPLSNDGSTIQYGEREVRTGPNRFALHFGEKVEDLREEYVLTKYDALLVKALNDFGDHKVGDEYLIKGAGKFIPCKHEEVKYELKGISLSDTEGKYVQDKDTGDARLVEGTEESEIYFLKSNERMFRKELTLDELVALGLKTQSSRDGVRVLTRQAANSSFLEDSSNALVLELEDNELVYIYDGSESRIEQGPKTTFLGPYERPKILNLSGGRPIEPNALKIALLKLGPDFIYDEIVVRTKDNARLRLNVTYKWRFDLDSDNLKKAFSIDDFVGYAAETLSSEIRSVAAKYDFEEFHAKSAEYVGEAIFGGNKQRVFDENGLVIFGVDIPSITPDDPKIAEKLNQAIKQNMDIYCGRLVLKAKLESEKQEVEGKLGIETERKKLIKSEIENQRLSGVEKAKIKAEQGKITVESEVAEIRLRSDVEIEASRKEIEQVVGELNKPGGEKYLDLQRARAFDQAEKLVVVPTDSKIVLPFVKTGIEE